MNKAITLAIAVALVLMSGLYQAMVCGKGNQSFDEDKDEESSIIHTTDISTNRIRDNEARVDLADIEVIPSSTRAREIYSNIVKSAAEEILWIFPTT
ncbi:MAG: hypothetical protein WB988_10690, partial [Candidatus Nitrosopolaris sp.]